jgi:fibro-slime domain-containing protein
LATEFYRTVHWTQVVDAGATGSQATLSLAADDDAWLFIDNNLKLDDGGVKPITAVADVVLNLSPGNHVFDLFFADRHHTESGITFTADLVPNQVPEPATLLLWGTTAAGLGTLVRRRKARRAAPEQLSA